MTAYMPEAVPAGVLLHAISTLLSPSRGSGVDMPLRPSTTRTITSIVHSLRTELPQETPLADASTTFPEMLRSPVTPTDVLGALRSSWLSRNISRDEIFAPNLYLLPNDDAKEHEELMLHFDVHTMTGAFFLNRYDALANVFEYLDKRFPKPPLTGHTGVGVSPVVILGEKWADAPTTATLQTSTGTSAHRTPIDNRLVSKKTLEAFKEGQALRFQDFLSLVADCTMTLSDAEFHGPPLAAKILNCAHLGWNELRSRARMALYRYNDHREPRGLKEKLAVATQALAQDRTLNSVGAQTPAAVVFPRLLQALVKDDRLLLGLGFALESQNPNTASDLAQLQSHHGGAGRCVVEERDHRKREVMTLCLFQLLESFPIVAFCDRRRVALAEEFIAARSKRRDDRPSSIFDEYGDAFAAAVVKFAALVFPLVNGTPDTSIVVSSSRAPLSPRSSVPVVANSASASVATPAAANDFRSVSPKRTESTTPRPSAALVQEPSAAPHHRAAQVDKAKPEYTDSSGRAVVVLKTGHTVVQPSRDEILAARAAAAASAVAPKQQQTTARDDSLRGVSPRRHDANEKTTTAQPRDGMSRQATLSRAVDPYSLADLQAEFATVMHDAPLPRELSTLPCRDHINTSNNVSSPPRPSVRTASHAYRSLSPPRSPQRRPALEVPTRPADSHSPPLERGATLTPGDVTNVMYSGKFPYRAHLADSATCAARTLQRVGRAYKRRRECGWVIMQAKWRAWRLGGSGGKPTPTQLHGAPPSTLAINKGVARNGRAAELPWSSTDPTESRLVPLNPNVLLKYDGVARAPLSTIGSSSSAYVTKLREELTRTAIEVSHLRNVANSAMQQHPIEKPMRWHTDVVTPYRQEGVSISGHSSPPTQRAADLWPREAAARGEVSAIHVVLPQGGSGAPTQHQQVIQNIRVDAMASLAMPHVVLPSVVPQGPSRAVPQQSTANAFQVRSVSHAQRTTTSGAAATVDIMDASNFLSAQRRGKELQDIEDAIQREIRERQRPQMQPSYVHRR